MPRSEFQSGPATDHYHETLGVDETPAADLGSPPDLTSYQPTAEKDQASGYAGLDSGGKLLAAQLPGAAATDVETAAAVAALSSVYQPLDSDLTAIAALTTTATGRSLLAAANAAAIRTISGAETSGAAAAAQAAAIAASQPLDSDLTAIAALTTTSFGRSFLDRADAAAGRTLLGLGTAATSATGAFDASGAAAAAQAASQPLDSDLTAIAALSTTSFGRSLLATADAAAARTALGITAGATPEVNAAARLYAVANFR